MTRLVVTAVVGLLAVEARASDLAERAARSYSLDTSGSTTALAPGERGVLVIAVRPEPGVHVQTQAPLRATISASPGLAPARDRLGWADVVGPRSGAPRLEVAFEATAPGPQSAKVRLEFFVCGSSWCVRQERELVLPVVVARASEARSYAPPSRPVGASEARR